MPNFLLMPGTPLRLTCSRPFPMCASEVRERYGVELEEEVIVWKES